MNFSGRVEEVKTYPTGKPSVRVRAYHDPRILVWAEWQTDLRGDPKVGVSVRVTSYGPIKIAL